MTRSEVLDEAKNIVNGQRQIDYGKPEDNFKIIADLWSVYLNENITSKDVAMMMILLKIARAKSDTGTIDNFVDIAGYSACAGEIWSNKSKEPVRHLDYGG